MKQKIKLGIILGVEFVAITVILILIFFAGKKTYKVTFDLNGGTLISGDLVQTVSQGKSATPPVVAKDGCHLRSWSASYKQVTHDIVVEAVWEWEIITTVGFVYSSAENSDYCTIESSFMDLYGDVYVPVRYGEQEILGIEDNVFRNHDGITNIYMLDGILSIGQSAFSECDELVSVELPGTLKKLGVSAFENCPKLEQVIISDELEVIPDRAFAGCTSLKEIVIPASVKTISENAFLGCTSLEKITFEVEEIKEEQETEKENSRKSDKETDIEEEITVIIKGLETIETAAFDGCEALTEIVLPKTVKNIAAGAFDNSGLTAIYLPISEADKPEGFVDGWNGDAEVKWDHVAPVTEEETDKKHNR